VGPDFRQEPVLRGSQTNLAEFGVIELPDEASELMQLGVDASGSLRANRVRLRCRKRMHQRT
jgi:hypothetical protein